MSLRVLDDTGTLGASQNHDTSFPAGKDTVKDVFSSRAL